jgi:hypothetical protein
MTATPADTTATTVTVTDATRLAKEASGAVPMRSTAPTKIEVTLETVRGLLTTYETEMAVNKELTDETGVTQQMALMRAIKMVLRLEGEDFNTGWQLLLTWVKSHLGDIMGVRYRGRKMDLATRMPSSDRKRFNALLHLLCSTADPAARVLFLTRYDYGRIHKLYEQDDVASKIEGFYLHS